MKDLIRRLEAAAGPDRELDLAIGALWPEPRPFSMSIRQQRGGKPPVYRFTASIDSAVALAERALPDTAWNIAGNAPDAKGKVICMARLWFAKGVGPVCEAPTAPIALCLAILHAKEPYDA
jgi:hypothetical protein